MAIAQLGPAKSGIQLVMILGVVLMATTVAPNLGMDMLVLAIVVWLGYNILNVMRLM